MDRSFLLPLVLTVLLLGVFAVNEWTGGALSDAVGFGGHHMLATTACGYDTGFAVPCSADASAHLGAHP